ncbi:MAG TPA: lysozyme inhibitor LprI family protein [Myxococcales bacterium]|nr:lysozyme inhibitor LprI family protein [Myxococcales bacterium]
MNHSRWGWGLVAIAALAAPSQARAGNGCENPKTPYDKTYCLAKLFVESDGELNQVYQELRKALKKDSQHALLGAQREWLAFRDQKCSAGGTIDVQCNYDVNRARTEFLRDRSRECKTGQCRDDLVGQKNWAQ